MTILYGLFAVPQYEGSRYWDVVDKRGWVVAFSFTSKQSAMDWIMSPPGTVQAKRGRNEYDATPSTLKARRKHDRKVFERQDRRTQKHYSSLRR